MQRPIFTKQPILFSSGDTVRAEHDDGAQMVYGPDVLIRSAINLADAHSKAARALAAKCGYRNVRWYGALVDDLTMVWVHNGGEVFDS